MSIVTKAGTVDIGGGRGRLAPDAAASLHRVDQALGRLLDVNSAWRDPKDQQRRDDAYRAYLAGGPWAPIALPPDESVHCKGEAVDTDDHTPAMVRLLLEHGWVQTVYRWVNGKWTLVEEWHFEYEKARDKHINDPTPEEDPMPENKTTDFVKQALKPAVDAYLRIDSRGHLAVLAGPASVTGNLYVNATGDTITVDVLAEKVDKTGKPTSTRFISTGTVEPGQPDAIPLAGVINKGEYLRVKIRKPDHPVTINHARTSLLYWAG